MESHIVSLIDKEHENQDNGLLLNEYFQKKLGNGRMLVATRHGSWSILSLEQYEALRSGEFAKDKILCRELKEKGIILDENSVHKIVDAFRENYHCLADARPLCIVYLTNRCNLNCEYCLSDTNDIDDADDLSYEMMEDIINFIAKMPHAHIALEFQGGETLLCFDMLKKFLLRFDERMKAAGKVVDSKVVVSNLTLMNEEIALFILKNNIGLCSSLDGPRELHDANRKYPDGQGSYDAVMKGIDFFAKIGRKIPLMPTITAESLKLDPKAIVDEYRKAGLDHIVLRPVCPIGRARSGSLLMEPKDYFEFWKKALDYMIALSMDGNVFYDKTVQDMLVAIFTTRRQNMCMRRPCGAGINHFAFYLDGSIYACDNGKKMDAFKLGNVCESSYEDVFLNTLQLRANTTEFQPLCDTCVYGAFCGSCMCKSYARSGKVVPMTPMDFDCKINKMMFDHIFDKMDDPTYRTVFEMWVRLKA
ncbi:MAG: radical SAM protein [archaeon]